MYGNPVRGTIDGQRDNLHDSPGKLASLCDDVAETREPLIIHRRGARDVAILRRVMSAACVELEVGREKAFAFQNGIEL